MGKASLAALVFGAVALSLVAVAMSDDGRSTSLCAAAPVEGGLVHAGPFTGHVSRRYVVDGRFRLYDLLHPPNGATRLSNKMAWFLPRKHAAEAPSLSVKGVRLAPPGRVFSDSLAEIFYSEKPEDRHVYASNLRPPTAGCWRLTFKTGRVTGSLVVLVRNG